MYSKGVCSKWDISISQSRYPTPGIPQYIVQIVNTCVSECAPSNIHLRCGWFASARIVNPRTFKRLSFDDCLVNGGQPLKSSQSIRFTYANSFMYPLEFKSANFCWAYTTRKEFGTSRYNITKPHDPCWKVKQDLRLWAMSFHSQEYKPAKPWCEMSSWNIQNHGLEFLYSIFCWYMLMEML